MEMASDRFTYSPIAPPLFFAQLDSDHDLVFEDDLDLDIKLPHMTTHLERTVLQG